MPLFHLSSEHFVEYETIPFATVDEARSKARELLAQQFAQTSLMTEQCQSWSCVIQDERCNFIERIVLAALVDATNGNKSGVTYFYPQ